MKMVLLVFSVIICLPGGLYAQMAGKIVSLQGHVEVQQSPWAPASVNQVLNTGDMIRTGRQSRAAILLTDETQLKINANTQLTLTAVRQTSNLLVRVAQSGARTDQSILNLRSGQVWVRSKKTPASVRLQTPAVTAAIRGSEFDLRVELDGESLLTVVEGSIDFRNEQGFVIVNAGEQGRARIGEAPTKTIILNPRDAVQWTLFYTASVSPRDYPFLYSSPEEAKKALADSSTDSLRRAQIEHDAGNSRAALDLLQGVAAPEAAEIRGWILLEQNRIDEALAELKGAPEQSARTRLALSLTYYRSNQFEAAYRYAALNADEDVRLKLQKATLDLLTGDVASCKRFLESVPPQHPSYSLVQGLLSNVYLAQNGKDEALAAATRAVQANPNSPSAYLNLSLVQQSFFDLPAATRSVERALALDPNFLQAQIQYAKLLFGAGNTGKAEEVIGQALANAPDEAAVHSTFGFIVLARGKTDEARTYFERSIQQDSSRGEPHLGLGIAHMRQIRLTDAVAEMLIAVTLEPQMSLYHSYLGKAFYEERKFEQAFSALSAATELDPRDPTPHLYSGIFENDLNRPGIAVRSLQEAIRLNDNRAVYRSRFVLDEDRATRNVKLAAAYNRLGLSEWANLEAIKSNLSDPTNSSTHLFLADTFLNLKGRTLAAGGELLWGRLLLPVNSNSFNAFNDYTTLFELPRINWTTEGRYETFDSYGGTLISSGGSRRFAFSSLLKQNRTDGWRPLNDDSRDFGSVNFLKFALTPHSDFLLSYLHQQTREGDHGASSFLVTEHNDPNRRAFTRINRVEIGYHQQFRPGSEFIAYFSGQKIELLSDDPDVFKRQGIDFGLRRSTREPNLSFQAAHLLKISTLQFKYGLDVFEGRTRQRNVLSFIFPSDPPEPVSTEFGAVERRKVRFKTIFLQSDYRLSPKFIVSGGINYDWANDNNFFDEKNRPIFRWNPQGAILITPNGSSTFRFAAMQVLQTHTQERLVPTHIHGFIFNQNEIPYSQSTAYNAGWDQRLSKHSFIRSTAFWRQRTTPLLDLQTGDPLDFKGHFYGAAVTLNQFLTERMTLVPEYGLNRSLDFFSLRHDHDVRLALAYTHPRGYAFRLQESYLRQRGRLGNAPSLTKVFTTDAFISYELPGKTGLILLRVTNLFDRRYEYLADPLALERRVPRRQISFSLQFFL